MGRAGSGGVRALTIITGFLTLDAVTVSNCNDSAVASWDNGQLLVTNSQLRRNKAFYGGAIPSSGTVTLESTTFVDNESNGGDAIDFAGSTLDATGCTFAGNSFAGGNVYTGMGSRLSQALETWKVSRTQVAGQTFKVSRAWHSFVGIRAKAAEKTVST